MESTWSNRETFRIDLNSVRDDNRVVALVGFSSPQLVPIPGSTVVAVDEDGTFYDAVVEAVLPDSRAYLRLSWQSQRSGISPSAITYGEPSFGVAGSNVR